MNTTLTLTGLTTEERTELIIAVGHHAEVLDTDAWDDSEEELRATDDILRLIAQRGSELSLTEDQHDILARALDHHEEAYSDTESTLRATRSLRVKLGV